MAEVNVKTLQTRISLKYDSYANWTKEDVEGQGAKLVLLPGELGICYIGDTNQESNVVPTVLFKVGDGTKTFKELPWASAKAADVYSWAKASDVVYNQANKTITFVKGNVDGSDKVITFNYVTLAEVQAITNGLASRIEALEGKFTGENDVQGQIDALDGRLDVIEGADTVEGSVAKALKDAKAYTDTREAAIETAYKAYADQAEADAISAAETASETKVATERARITAIEGRLDAIEGTEGAIADALDEAKSYADQAELDAVASAKSYTDGRETAITTAYQTYADQAEADAKSYSDGKLEAAVEAQEAIDEAQNTEINKKLDKTVYDAYIAGKEMSDAELKTYADGVAGTAKSEAIAAAKTETETQINTLVTSGQVKTNTDAIAAMNTAYKAADEALDGRLDTVEAKLADVTNVMDFRGAVTELPAVDGYQNGDVIVVTDGDNRGKEYVLSEGAWVEFGNTDANSAAISDLQGRMTTAEGEIDALQTAVTTTLPAAIETKLATETFNSFKSTHENGHAKSAAEITSEINTAVSGEETARKAADKAITDAIGTSADSKDTATVYGAIADAKAAGTGAASEASRAHSRLDTVEPKVTTLQDIVDGYTSKGSIKSAIDAAAELAQKGVDDAATAQGEIDALELVVGDETTGLAATKAIADKNKADIADLTTAVSGTNGLATRIAALETSVDTATTGLKDRMTTAEGNITALQTLTGENGAIRSEIADAKKAGTDAAAAVTALANGQVATNKTNIEGLDSRVTAIEGDYLKQADLFIINCGTSTTVTHTAPTNN